MEARLQAKKDTPVYNRIFQMLVQSWTHIYPIKIENSKVIIGLNINYMEKIQQRLDPFLKYASPQ